MEPAVLEQRIGRAHRMGQERPVHAYVLVTTGTIEENLLATLAAKRELALAALDPDSELDRVELAGGIEGLKRRLEQLLGAKPEAPVATAEDAVEPSAVERPGARVAAAGGRFVAAALDLLRELLPQPAGTYANQVGEALRAQIAQAIDVDAAGRARLTLPLPDRGALDGIALALGGVLARASGASAPVN